MNNAGSGSTRLTLDAAVIASCLAAVTAWVRLLRELREAIHAYDEQIETIARQHPDFARSSLVIRALRMRNHFIH